MLVLRTRLQSWPSHDRHQLSEGLSSHQPRQGPLQLQHQRAQPLVQPPLTDSVHLTLGTGLKKLTATSWGMIVCWKLEASWAKNFFLSFLSRQQWQQWCLTGLKKCTRQFLRERLTAARKQFSESRVRSLRNSTISTDQITATLGIIGTGTRVWQEWRALFLPQFNIVLLAIPVLQLRSGIQFKLSKPHPIPSS
jgi:hypothetical protein